MSFVQVMLTLNDLPLFSHMSSSIKLVRTLLPCHFPGPTFLEGSKALLVLLLVLVSVTSPAPGSSWAPATQNFLLFFSLLVAQAVEDELLELPIPPNPQLALPLWCDPLMTTSLEPAAPSAHTAPAHHQQLCRNMLSSEPFP